MDKRRMNEESVLRDGFHKMSVLLHDKGVEYQGVDAAKVDRHGNDLIDSADALAKVLAKSVRPFMKELEDLSDFSRDDLARQLARVNHLADEVKTTAVYFANALGIKFPIDLEHNIVGPGKFDSKEFIVKNAPRGEE